MPPSAGAWAWAATVNVPLAAFATGAPERDRAVASTLIRTFASQAIGDAGWNTRTRPCSAQVDASLDWLAVDGDVEGVGGARPVHPLGEPDRQGCCSIDLAGAVDRPEANDRRRGNGRHVDVGHRREHDPVGVGEPAQPDVIGGIGSEHRIRGEHVVGRRVALDQLAAHGRLDCAARLARRRPRAGDPGGSGTRCRAGRGSPFRRPPRSPHCRRAGSGSPSGRGWRAHRRRQTEHCGRR